MLRKVKTGELIGSERVEGTGEEGMFTMVDELTKRIKENFKLSAEEISSDLDEEVGKITTSSPEAYKYYSEGRQYHTIGGAYLRRIMGYTDFIDLAGMLKGLGYGVQVAHTVVDYCHTAHGSCLIKICLLICGPTGNGLFAFYRLPLVDGVLPFIRSSASSAMRMARPRALNTVSAM